MISKKVFIHSIPRESAYNIHEWTNDSSGKKINKNKIGNLINTKYPVFFSSKVGGYATGLYKPWLENGAQKKDKAGNPLTLQHYYEQKHGKPTGYYSNIVSDPRGENFDESKKSYFDRFFMTMNDGTTVLDLDNPDDEIRYEVILESPFFANSEKEWRTYKWPKAQFYIALENESDEIKYQKSVAKSGAIAELHASDLTLPYKRQVIVILNISNARTILQEAQVHNLLMDYIEASTGTVGSNIDKFKELTNLIKTPKGRIELEARYLLQEAQDFNVIREKQGSYIWVRPTGTITIGETYTEAIDFILNPKKAILIDELKDEIKIKK